MVCAIFTISQINYFSQSADKWHNGMVLSNSKYAANSLHIFIDDNHKVNVGLHMNDDVCYGSLLQRKVLYGTTIVVVNNRKVLVREKCISNGIKEYTPAYRNDTQYIINELQTKAIVTYIFPRALYYHNKEYYQLSFTANGFRKEYQKLSILPI